MIAPSLPFSVSLPLDNSYLYPDIFSLSQSAFFLIIDFSVLQARRQKFDLRCSQCSQWLRVMGLMKLTGLMGLYKIVTKLLPSQECAKGRKSNEDELFSDVSV